MAAGAGSGILATHDNVAGALLARAWFVAPFGSFKRLSKAYGPMACKAARSSGSSAINPTNTRQVVWRQAAGADRRNDGQTTRCDQC